jgi:hypothetical protein
MNDAASKPTPKHPRAAKKQSMPRPAGEVIVIEVPRPAATTINKNRPISELIKAQLQHFRHAESARLPKHKRSDVKIEEIRTEAEAAKYIREITHLLHPQRRKKSNSRRPS